MCANIHEFVIKLQKKANIIPFLTRLLKPEVMPSLPIVELFHPKLPKTEILLEQQSFRMLLYQKPSLATFGFFFYGVMLLKLKI